MEYLEAHSKKVCKNLLIDLVNISKGHSSIKFFRKDSTTTLIWLFILEAYGQKKIINIEDISRGISNACRISKPSLRLILENAKDQSFLKFTHNKTDSRSWMIEPEEISISEFNEWAKYINLPNNP
tara:strand:- start:817 stop:1194 length:378 start_codon:yes stop_codon:yes gene_type:complete